MFRYSSRFWLYAPTGIFVAIAIAAMVNWWLTANAFEKKLAALKGREAIPGVTIDWDSATVGGFPFRIDADFDGLTLTGAGPRGPFAWRSEKFALHALTYGRNKTVYEAAGRQHLEWTDGRFDHRVEDFLPGLLHASTVRDAKGLARFDLDIVRAQGRAFAADRLQFHMRRDPDGADLDLMLKADGFRPVGQPARAVQAYATLSRAVTLMPLLAGDKSLPDSRQAWLLQSGKAKLTQVQSPDLVAGALSALY